MREVDSYVDDTPRGGGGACARSVRNKAAFDQTYVCKARQRKMQHGKHFVLHFNTLAWSAECFHGYYVWDKHKVPKLKSSNSIISTLSLSVNKAGHESTLLVSWRSVLYNLRYNLHSTRNAFVP